MLAVVTATLPWLTVSGNAYAWPPTTLAEALERSVVPTRERIPLLVIGAEETRSDRENPAAEERLSVFSDDDAKPALGDILESYNRHIISCASVQVVAPIQRVALNTKLGRPEDWVDYGQDQAVKRLLLSLDEAQWSKVTSAEGLAIADLSSNKQKAWFRAVVPQPFVLQQMTLQVATGQTKTVEPEQVRLRFVRQMLWSYRTGSNNTLTITRMEQHKEATYWTPEPRAATARTYPESLKNVVRLREPNKLKQSDLGFDSPPLYGKRVALAGAATIGEVVARVAAVTGLDIYADRRVSGRTVRMIGRADAAPDAADVIKALCYAVGGAIRKVGDDKGNTVFILTSDRTGLAAERINLAEWAADLDALHQEAEEEFVDAMAARNIASRIAFAPDAPGVSPQAMARAEKDHAAGISRSGMGWRIALEELSPEARLLVDAELSSLRQSNQEAQLDAKNIYARFVIKSEILVPGYGTFTGPDIGKLDTLLRDQPKTSADEPGTPGKEIVTFPQAVAGNVALKVAPLGDGEVDKVVAWARAHRFTAIFLPIALWNKQDTATLAHAITAGKANNIKIYPVVSLWTAPPHDKTKSDSAPNNLPRLHNLFGETLLDYARRRKDAPGLRRRHFWIDMFTPPTTIDWLDGEQELVREAIAEQLKRVSTLSDIAGVVIADGAPPGFDINSGFPTGSVAGYSGGYSNALRAALVRQANIDPIDLPPAEEMAPFFPATFGYELLPFFTVDAAIYEKFRQYPAYRKNSVSGAWEAVAPVASLDYDPIGWNALRREQNRAWVADIRRRANLPATLALLWQEPEQHIGNVSFWTAPWKTSETLPPATRPGGAFLSVAIDPEYNRDIVRNALKIQPDWHLQIKSANPFTGVVVDISRLDTDKALALLDVLATAP